MQANEKNVRISAMEENEVKIFLISCSPKDADKLFTALEYRYVGDQQNHHHSAHVHVSEYLS